MSGIFRRALNKLTDRQLEDLSYEWRFQARPTQLPPPGDWTRWLFLGGRGAGKTRSGAEFVKERVDSGKAKRVHLIARNPADARDTMIEGDSGLLAVYPLHDPNRPTYSSTTRSLTWPNGAKALIFSSYEPDQLRGPACDTLWADELAAWQRLKKTWDNAMLGFRSGPDPRCVVTTTPRNVKTLRDLIEMAGKPGVGVRITHDTTYANLENLAPMFREEILSQYEGTTLGRQELGAELLGEVEGALWKREWIENARRKVAPDRLIRVTVGVDPSGTERGTGNACGIVIAGIDSEGHVWVLGDHSLHASPAVWASKVIGCYEAYQADRIVAEGQQGVGIVKLTLQTILPGANVRMVNARRGKTIRAEPVAALYEQGRVHHVGELPQLEDELCLWTPEEDSPDRLDALCWAVTDLALNRGSGTKSVFLPL